MPLLYRLCSPWGGAPGCSWGTSRGKVSAPAVTSPPTPTSPSPQHWVPGPAEGFRRSCSQAPTCAPWKPEDLAPHALRNPLHFQGPPTWPSPHSQAEHPNTTPQTPPHSLHLASCPCPGEHTYRPQLSCSRLDAAPLGGGGMHQGSRGCEHSPPPDTGSQRSSHGPSHDTHRPPNWKIV